MNTTDVFNATEITNTLLSFRQVSAVFVPFILITTIIQKSFHDLLEVLALHSPKYIYSLPIPGEYIGSFLIICVSLLSVIVGSYSTISKPKNALVPDSQSAKFDPSDNDHCKYYILNEEQLQYEDARQFTWLHTALIPITSCLGLYGLYYSMQNWSIDNVNKIMNIYAVTVSPIMIYSTLEYLLTSSLRKLKIKFARFRLVLVKEPNLPLGIIDPNLKPQEILKQYPHYVHIWKPSNHLQNPQQNFVFDTKPLYLVPITIAVTAMFYDFTPTFSTRSTNWIVSDFVAFCFTVAAINQLQFGKFKLVFALLAALFFYDIYFVFGTKIMETVATGLSIPIKFIFPKNADFPPKFMLIGLGDLVLPGCFLSLCLRYDYYRFYQSNNVPFHHLNSVPKPYFITGLLAYTISLIITSVVMHVFQAGQPALLYIVPSLFIAIGYQAWKHGEIAELWQFNDDLEKLPTSHDTDEEEDDEDYRDDPNDSYDEWEDRVELKRSQYDQDTDVDHEEDIIYQFLSSDEDDDTFIIGEDDDEDEYDDDDMVVVEEEIDIVQTLKLDLSEPVREWYDEEY